MAWSTLLPQTSVELSDAVQQAGADGVSLEIRGGGSKSDFGTPDRTNAMLDMSSFSSVVDYDPAELVLTAGAGAPRSPPATRLDCGSRTWGKPCGANLVGQTFRFA